MGLDMYLENHIYIGANYEHNNVTGKIELYKEGIEIPINLHRVTSIIERVGYWRKAYAINKWFEEHLQDAVCNCQEYWVPVETLEELYNTCLEVLKNKEKASELLPVDSMTDMGYDEYYFNDIEDTIEILKPIVEGDIEGDFYYSCSW